MTTLRVIGPIYTLDDQTRLQDVDAGCGTCGKRLAICIHDPHGCWPQGQLVCIDCGTLAPTPSAHEITIRQYYRSGLVIGFCSCRRWRSNAGSRVKVGLEFNRHLEAAA